MNSIVIPTYCPTMDVEEKLFRCLNSLFMYSRMPFELIVVEQGIAAALPLIASAAGRGRYLTYLRLPEPVGYAKAVNMGVSHSRGDHLLIVNNDIEVGENWDGHLVETYDAMHRPGLLSASDQPEKKYAGIEEPCSWWSCVCIGSKVWGEVGALDDDKLNYRLHDQDWSIRAYKRGLQVGRHHGVQVRHDESSTYRHMAVNVDETAERAEMRRRYGVEHFFEYIQTHPRR